MAQPDEASSYENPRLEAPNTLLRHGIPCVVWAEDALWYYGVRTVCFDLHLIVEDSEAAAKCLDIETSISGICLIQLLEQKERNGNGYEIPL